MSTPFEYASRGRNATCLDEPQPATATIISGTARKRRTPEVSRDRLAARTPVAVPPKRDNDSLCRAGRKGGLLLLRYSLRPPLACFRASAVGRGSRRPGTQSCDS